MLWRRLRGIGPALAGKLGEGRAFALTRWGRFDRFQCSLRPDPAADSALLRLRCVEGLFRSGGATLLNLNFSLFVEGLGALGRGEMGFVGKFLGALFVGNFKVFLKSALTVRVNFLKCAPLSGQWGRSSVGRAPQWHCGGQEFESPRLHHFSPKAGATPTPQRPPQSFSFLFYGFLFPQTFQRLSVLDSVRENWDSDFCPEDGDFS